MASENIMMDAVKAGGDRQELHEAIREHSMEATKRIKQEGKENDLIDRIANDPRFMMSKEEIMKIMEPKNFVGRAPQQTEEFFKDYIDPVLEANRDDLGLQAEINI